MRILFFFLLMMMIGVPICSAETIACPDMGYKLVDNQGIFKVGPPGSIFEDDRGSITFNTGLCTYEKKQEFSVHWVSYFDHSVHNYPDCRNDPFLGEKKDHFIHIHKKRRKIDIQSETHLSSVKVLLSRKEFRESNRQKWIDAGLKLLKMYQSRALWCDESTGEWSDYPGNPTDGVQKTIPKINSPRVTPKKSTAPAPVQSSDDVDAEIDDIINRLKGN